MSVGLSIPGRYPVSGILSKGPGPSEWLESLKEWLIAREGDELVSCHAVEGPEGEVLLAQLHPFAEELQVSCPRTGEVTLTAATGTCGPGYHEHVVGLAHAMASELKVSWRPSEAGHGDDTGFFESGDRSTLEQAMIEDAASAARELPAAAGVPPLFLIPPTSPSYVHDGAVSTPLGPRDASWLARVQSGDRCALDAMPWSMRGRGHEHHRARALAIAWCEARWRAPLNEAEESALREIDRCLRLARDGGAVDLPWSEWASIREWLGEDGAELAGRTGAAAPRASQPGSRLGYRHGDVVPQLPGEFTMRVPGSFSEEIDDDGTWHGTDGARTIYATAGRIPPVADMPGDAVKLLAKTAFEGEPFESRGERVVARAALRQDQDDDGTKLWVLACGAAQGSFLLRATIVFPDPSDRDWALATFRSIDRGADAAAPRRAGLPGITG